MVGARGFEPPTPLLPKHGCSLLTLILTRLAETLVAYCVNKCQEESIRLTQIWHSVFYADRSTPSRSLKKFPYLKI